MGNQHLNLLIIFHTVFDNCLPHKHLATFLHATMNLVKKSKNQKVRFAQLKVAICQVENCNLARLVRKLPKLRHTNCVVITLLSNTLNPPIEAVKNSLTRVAVERIESSRSGPGMPNLFEIL